MQAAKVFAGLAAAPLADAGPDFSPSSASVELMMFEPQLRRCILTNERNLPVSPYLNLGGEESPLKFRGRL